MSTRAGLDAGVAALPALAPPLSASAHVSVTPARAEPGGYAQLTFRVPTERDDTGTVRLEVTLPPDTPFASVSYQPVAGWTATVTTGPLADFFEVSFSRLTEAATGIVWQA